MVHPAIAVTVGLLSVALSLGAQVAPARWTLVERQRIGGIRDSDLVLSKPIDIVSTSNGTLVILQQGNPRVVVVSARGELLREVGRTGSGPGELRNPVAVGLLGDTLWISDEALRRVSVYLLTGRHVKDLTMGNSARELRIPSVRALLADHSLLISGVPTSGVGVPSEELYGTLRRSGGMDTLFRARLPEYLSVPMRVNGEEGRMQTVQPFSDHPITEISPDGKLAVQVDRSARTATPFTSFLVTWKGTDARPVAEKRSSYQPVAFTSGLRERMLPRFRTAPPGLPGKLEIDERTVRQALERPATKHVPTVSGLTIATDSSVWLRREALLDGKTQFTVLSPTHAIVAAAEVPFEVLTAFVRPPFHWAAVIDEEESYFIIKYEIVKK